MPITSPPAPPRPPDTAARNTAALPWALDPHVRRRWLSTVAGGAAGVFLDYDGTLTPIADRPEQATLGASTRARLSRLAARCPVTIVTGRDVAVARGFVRLDEIGYAGCHGLDIEGAAGSGLRYEAAQTALPALDGAEAALRQGLSGVAGALVERKRYSVSTHYRLVAERDLPAVEAAVAEVALRHPALRRERGKKVFELRPDVSWGKGSAVAWLIDALGLDPGAAVFIGDDETDEHAFALLNGCGVPIVVEPGDRPTNACYRVRDPGEVTEVLDLLIEHLDVRRRHAGPR